MPGLGVEMAVATVEAVAEDGGVAAVVELGKTGLPRLMGGETCLLFSGLISPKLLRFGRPGQFESMRGSEMM